MFDELNNAIQAAKDHDYQTARNLLREILLREPDNENAWLWLSQVVQTDRERRICLRQALRINPHNIYAKQGLELLNSGISPKKMPYLNPHKRRTSPILNQCLLLLTQTRFLTPNNLHHSPPRPLALNTRKRTID